MRTSRSEARSGSAGRSSPAGRPVSSSRATARVLAVHLTSGSVVVIGAGIVVLAMVLGLSAEPASFDENLDNIANFGLTTTAFLGPLTALSAAVAVARSRRSKVLGLARTTPRGLPGVTALVVVAAWVWTTAALILLLVLLSLLDGPRFRHGDAAVLVVLAELVVAVSATFGAVAARYSARPVTPAVAALVAFAWLYGASFPAGPVRFFAFTYNDVFLQPTARINGRLTGLQVGFLLAVLVLLGLALLEVPRRTGLVAAAVAVVLAVVTATGLVGVRPEDAVAARHLTRTAPCRTSSGYTLCYWPYAAAQVGGQLTWIVAVGALVPGFDEPRVYVQTGLTNAGAPIEPLPLVPPERAAVFTAADAFVRAHACTRVPADQTTRLTDWITYHFSADPTSTKVLIDPVFSRPFADQQRWAAALLRSFEAACR